MASFVLNIIFVRAELLKVAPYVPPDYLHYFGVDSISTHSSGIEVRNLGSLDTVTVIYSRCYIASLVATRARARSGPRT